MGMEEDSELSNRLPRSTGTVVGLGTEPEKLPTTHAAEPEAEDIVPGAIDGDAGKRLAGKRGRQRNLDDGAVCEVGAGDAQSLPQLGGRMDGNMLPQVSTMHAIRGSLLRVVHRKSVAPPNGLKLSDRGWRERA